LRSIALGTRMVWMHSPHTHGSHLLAGRCYRPLWPEIGIVKVAFYPFFQLLQRCNGHELRPDHPMPTHPYTGPNRKPLGFWPATGVRPPCQKVKKREDEGEPNRNSNDYSSTTRRRQEEIGPESKTVSNREYSRDRSIKKS
jgi:hypothetical protein